MLKIFFLVMGLVSLLSLLGFTSPWRALKIFCGGVLLTEALAILAFFSLEGDVVRFFAFFGILTVGTMVTALASVLGSVNEEPEPFAETPAGRAKQLYDDLPPEEKESFRKAARFGAQMACTLGAHELKKRGHDDAADTLRRTGRAL